MATYYVDSAAAGGGNGSVGTPWNALSSITGLAAGDTIWIKGTFTGKWTMPSTSGTATAPIRYIGYTSTTGDGGTFTISGGAQNLAYSASNIQLHNAVLTGSTSSSVFDDTGDCVFYRCTFAKGAGSATSVAGNLGTKRFVGCIMTDVSIGGRQFSLAGCTITTTSTTGWGVSVDGFRQCDFIIGCRISGFSSGGIEIQGSANCPVIALNTIEGCGGPGLSIGSSALCTLVYGNIFSDNATKNVSITPSSFNLVSSYNAIFGNASDLSSKAAFDTGTTITLSGDPLTGLPGSWVVNDTAGAGALLRAALPWGADIGAGQYVGGGGGGGGLFRLAGMGGGFPG